MDVSIKEVMSQRREKFHINIRKKYIEDVLSHTRRDYLLQAKTNVYQCQEISEKVNFGAIKDPQQATTEHYRDAARSASTMQLPHHKENSAHWLADTRGINPSFRHKTIENIA
jgi:hypothetical protein